MREMHQSPSCSDRIRANLIEPKTCEGRSLSRDTSRGIWPYDKVNLRGSALVDGRVVGAAHELEPHYHICPSRVPSKGLSEARSVRRSHTSIYRTRIHP